MENKFHYYNQRKANSTSIWLLYLLLGWSYGSLGQVGTQILFYLTFGGIGIWAFIRLFTLNSSINKYNKGIAQQLGFNADEMMQMGLI